MSAPRKGLFVAATLALLLCSACQVTIAAGIDANADGSGVAIEAMAIDGDPAAVLLDEAERGRYDLLVMGNKGMTGVSRFLMGSVPNKVSHHATSNILIVRTT